VAPGVRPAVRVWAETRDGWVQLGVRDNGIGIAPEHQEPPTSTAHEVGANSHLVKPSSPDALLEMLRVIDAYWMITAEKPDLAP
jgi:hypothetical protein